ncbi:hypothetical protein CDD82_1861 [Ophiocordyceps australis]|uniref:Transcription factor TFIIIC triple barrel domain-containing protein n=1 Tax=Ophiocordyceps australis TaxID=1399860 RepID=A0A2C5YZ13_9HYPO|nr:hypothetical protein CDD82_1861 [Ophiocordyceps australis]
MSNSTAPEALDPGRPAAVSVNIVPQQVATDESEEWEYEYSTTAKETYYLTIELSYPDFMDKSLLNPHHSRGGYYKNWLGKSTEGLGTSKSVASDDEDVDAGGEQEAEPGNGEEADDMPFLDPLLRAHDERTKTGEAQLADGEQQGPGEDKEPEADHDGGEAQGEIQILDLHSHHPIISYRGRVFEGEWAEVVGTEAILAKHDATLPALRNMADEVDFLAASSSRIMTTEKVLKRRGAQQDRLAAVRDEWNIHIPSLRDKTGERAQQARFLENLIALKKKKGHSDHVTVYATDGPGKDWNDRRGVDYRPRANRRRARLEEEEEEEEDEEEEDEDEDEAGRGYGFGYGGESSGQGGARRQRRRRQQGMRRRGFSKDDATSQLAGIYNERESTPGLQAWEQGLQDTPGQSLDATERHAGALVEAEQEADEHEHVGCNEEDDGDVAMAGYG